MTDRLYENLGVWLPAADDCDGAFQIPRIAPVSMPCVDAWRPFTEVLSRGADGNMGVQMYCYDYQLVRLWHLPTRYPDLLRKAGCVLSPDYSLYLDTPAALNIFNHYRKHWIAAYWQREGVTVIPSICWADADSFSWCFDGEPVGGVVSVSSVGTQRRAEDKRAFMLGYDAMLERLQPDTVLFFGIVPEGARGNICPVDAFYNTVEKRRGKV